MYIIIIITSHRSERSYLSGTAGLYNQLHTGTGSRWSDQYKYRRSDRGHWHTRLCLNKKQMLWVMITNDMNSA